MAPSSDLKSASLGHKRRIATASTSGEIRKKRRVERKTNPAVSATPSEPATTPPPSQQFPEAAASPTNDEEEEPKNGVSVDPIETPNAANTSSKERFIVFIGNLPYTATTAKLQAHFAAIRPTSIRHLTQKDDSTRSKGYAFLEFDAYDRMKTCLKLYHHSAFEDGKRGVRRINVELTAGGGGKGKGRREKLKAKNSKLGEERKRRAVEEAKKEKRRQKKQARANADVSGGAAVEDAGAAVADSAAMDDTSIHPSRRAQVRVR